MAVHMRSEPRIGVLAEREAAGARANILGRGGVRAASSGTRLLQISEGSMHGIDRVGPKARPFPGKGTGGGREGDGRGRNNQLGRERASRPVGAPYATRPRAAGWI